MEIALTKISSKGQIVIPSELRQDFKEGDQLMIIKNAHQLILKKTSELDKNLKEDLAFAKRTEAARRRIEQGKGIRKDFDAFIAEMKTW